MLVHSSTMAPTSGLRDISSFPAFTISCPASAMSMSSFSALMSTRKNSHPFSVPVMGVSRGAPAAARCAGVNVDALMVTTPTRLPGGNVACTHGTCINEDVATGTATAAASSCWNSDRKPQLVVIASAPRRTRSRAASMKSGSSPRAPCSTTFSGLAPRTTRYSTGKGHVVPLPMSPGMRGKRASSMRMPSGTP